MVKLQVLFKADLENITNLKKTEGSEWYFRVKCTNCGEIHEKPVSLSAERKLPLKGSRGEASLVLTCKLCKRENSADIVSGPGRAYNAAETGKFAPILCLDCRGLEPVEWEVRGDFEAQGTESGTHFEDIDLSDGDWADYDEAAKTSVSIGGIAQKLQKIK